MSRRPVRAAGIEVGVGVDQWASGSGRRFRFGALDAQIEGDTADMSQPGTVL